MWDEERRGLSARQTLVIIVMTAIYLVVELAFNARLLDVTGGLQVQDVHGLENYGRALSGVAVALFVLQVQLGRRAGQVLGARAFIVMALLCAASAVGTFAALKWVVDGLVERSSGEFRKAAATLVVVRAEMLRGDAVLDGLQEDAALFERPEGKVFAALFPALGLQIWPQLDRRLGPAKNELMQRALASSFGGAQGYYDGTYRNAMKDLAALYRGRPPGALLRRIADQEDARAWAEYTARLARRHMTPETVPWPARRRVWEEVRARVPVPGNWDLANRAVFSEAVYNETLRQLTSNPASVFDDGRIVARGLSWNAYVEHPVMQQRLRDALQLPPQATVRAEYASAAEFESQLFRPMVAWNAKAELDCLAAPPWSFVANGSNADRGREAAQAALVPPIALLCSLLGAISHLAKLLYQLTRLLVTRHAVLAPLGRHVLLVPLAVVLVAGVAMAAADNAVTLSRVHRSITATALEGSGGAGPGPLVPLVLGALHIVEIGQGYGYPLNDFMRRRLLGSFEFNAPAVQHTPAATPATKPAAGRPVVAMPRCGFKTS